jgi:hypothetical protein
MSEDGTQPLAAWRRGDRLQLGNVAGSPVAYLEDPDRDTWESLATVGTRDLRVGPLDRRGGRFALIERDWELGTYTRWRNRGGGRLGLDDGTQLKLLPIRPWRPRWRVRDGSRAIGEVIARPRDNPTLTFVWTDGEPPIELALLVSYAVLIDEIVSRLAGPVAPTAGP